MRFSISNNTHNCILQKLWTLLYIHSNGHNFCKIRLLNAIDHEYLYKRCLYEVFCVK